MKNKTILIILVFLTSFSCRIYGQEYPKQLFCESINHCITELLDDSIQNNEYSMNTFLIGINIGFEDWETETNLQIQKTIDTNKLIKSVKNFKIKYFYSKDEFSIILKNPKNNNLMNQFFNVELSRQSDSTIDILIYDYSFSHDRKSYNRPELFGCLLIPNGELVIDKQTNDWKFLERNELKIRTEQNN